MFKTFFLFPCMLERGWNMHHVLRLHLQTLRSFYTYTGDKDSSVGICFSRWLFNQDLETIKRVTSSSIYNPLTVPEKAIDGAYIRYIISAFGSDSYDLNPWFLIELDEIKLIQTILIVPRLIIYICVYSKK